MADKKTGATYDERRGDDSPDRRQSQSVGAEALLQNPLRVSLARLLVPSTRV